LASASSTQQAATPSGAGPPQHAAPGCPTFSSFFGIFNAFISSAVVYRYGAIVRHTPTDGDAAKKTQVLDILAPEFVAV
jgi:hypothetical protein